MDAKSNREGARKRTDAEQIAAFRSLWSRPLATGVRVSEFWVVSERSGGLGTGTHLATPLFGDDLPPLAGTSFIVVEPDPIHTAADLLVSSRGLTPLAAELLVLAFAQAVGKIASDNGRLPLDRRQRVTPSEAEHIASRVLNAVDAERLEGLLRSGFVRAVDFATPLDDAGFYRGVDVQPGHFAAGLAIERPEQVARVIEALDRARHAVIRGPSGAGKSGLMWNAVIAARHTRRWFRVNTLVVPSPDALTAFFDAYANVRIGFVIDDVGRGGIGAWNALSRHSDANIETVMIGSIRSEDAVLLPARHTIAEIDASSDPLFAQALWIKLRERGQTDWSGWREAWDRSNGLLLEYGHILTSGDRLEAVVLDQIRMRLDERRDEELAVLRASALAAAHGGTVRIEAMRENLGLSPGDLARALQRLLDEHLIRFDATGTSLAGLHALRANAIARALADVGFSTIEAQARDAIALSDDTSLETIVAGLVAGLSISVEKAADAVEARLHASSSLFEMASAVRGLRVGGTTLAVREWLASLANSGVPRKFATTSAMMGIAASIDSWGIDAFRKLAELGAQLQTALGARRIPDGLATILIEGLRKSTEVACLGDCIDALTALANAAVTAKHRDELSSVTLTFDKLPIDDVVSILDAVEAIDPAIAVAWVAGQDLLARLSAETPFALAITREATSNGLVVHGDVFEAALTPGEEPNDRLVGHVHAIMRLEPRAHVAHVRLVGFLGEKSLHLDAEKRIRRENAPPRATIQVNRRVIDVVATQVGGGSWSNYLSNGAELLRTGLRSFERLLDSVMVERPDLHALEELNKVVDACDDLIAPAGPPRVDHETKSELTGRHLTPLQNLISSVNGKLIKRIAELPDGAGALAGYVEGLLAQIGEAKVEPWLLVRDSYPRDLDSMRVVLQRIELVALEAHASNSDPRKRWRKPDGKARDAFAFVAARSRGALEARIESCRAHLLELLVTELPGVQLTASTPEDGIGWPRAFVATFPIKSLSDFKGWNDEARLIGGRLRSKMLASEDITLVPLLNGAAAIEYAYQLGRGDEKSIEREMLLAAGQLRLLAKPSLTVLSRIRVPLLQHPPELERVCTAVTQCIGLTVLGLGRPDRPEAERACLASAIAVIVEDGPTLLSRFESSEDPTIVLLRSWVHAFMSNDDNVTINLTDAPTEIQDILVEWTWNQSLSNH